MRLSKGFALLSEGMGSIFQGIASLFAPPSSKYDFSYKYRTDAEALAGDWANVGADLTKAMQTIATKIDNDSKR